jgi:hypothetical protein
MARTVHTTPRQALEQYLAACKVGETFKVSDFVATFVSHYSDSALRQAVGTAAVRDGLVARSKGSGMYVVLTRVPGLPPAAPAFSAPAQAGQTRALVAAVTAPKEPPAVKKPAAAPAQRNSKRPSILDGVTLVDAFEEPPAPGSVPDELVIHVRGVLGALQEMPGAWMKVAVCDGGDVSKNASRIGTKLRHSIGVEHPELEVRARKLGPALAAVFIRWPKQPGDGAAT